MESRLKPLYDRLPAALQNLALTAVSAHLHQERYGGDFAARKAFLERSQWFSEEELHAYQCERLQEIIAYAHAKVPYYTRVMHENGIAPADIRTPEDLAAFPLLTKEDIKRHFNELLSTDYSADRVAKGHTSGTTGSPLEICYDPGLMRMNYAMLDRQYAWAHTRLAAFGDRVAVIRGNVVVPLDQHEPPFWRINYLHRQLLLSSFHLAPDNITAYVGELRRFRPKVLDGYPSTVYVLAKHLKNLGETLPLHAVLTSSETLFDFQRETIESSFQCRVFDYFGAAERVVFAAECDHHEGHHLASEFGITEILDTDGRAATPGTLGKLVATTLHNRAMPLIRYVTNDMTALRPRRCSCGRALPLIDDVATKAEDLLTLRDGRLISPSVLTHPFKPLTSIAASQIVQEDLDTVVVRVVPTAQFSAQDERQLIAGLAERLGEAVTVRVERVPELERTRSGKFKWVISKVKLGI